MSETQRRISSKGAADERTAPVNEKPWRRWIVPLVSLAAVILFGLVLQHKLRDDVWAYYTDGESLRVAAKENKERMVLWEDPRQHIFEQPTGAEQRGSREQSEQASQQRVEAAFSPDGATMVLTRWRKPTSDANSNAWSRCFRRS